MPVTSIENLDEYHKVVNSPTPAIIQFWATWSGPCRIISPAFEKHSDKPENAKLKFYKLDTDAVPDATNEAGIRTVPTFIVFHNGNKVDEMTGTNSTVLANLIAKYV
ncbi:thioredoxin [Mycena albidolilacea]|uniref:Thioredoxin n=1 Tax=Mycena albidolilacea TaxID=1033008 RepID=A0AAD6ZTA4_9AGAR|nr:thioredoxin [Mycena albidolilacea]